MSKEINTPQNNSEEVDLGQLFKLIGSMFDRFFSFLGKILNKLFLAFVWCVFFIKKHIVLLLIAGFLGFGYGLIKENFSEPVFKSSILIKQNYNTGEALYDNINYYNNLISTRDYSTLAQELSIDSIYITSIFGFDVKSLVGENQRLIEFNNYTRKLDTTLASTIVYKEYLENVEDYIYDIQQISINSQTNDNFNLVFEAIIEKLNSNKYFKREQERDLRQLENREIAVKNALAQSDSLQKIYKKVLEKTTETTKGAQTSITIDGTDEKNKTREFDLYLNNIELRKELVSIEREKENKQFIMETLSTIPSKGFMDDSIEIFNKSVSKKIFYLFSFPFFLFFILTLIEFVKFLEKFKSRV